MVLPAQEQAEHRHQHHIHGGQKTGLGRGRVQRDADLLGRTGREQKGAADHPGGQQLLFFFRSPGPAVRAALAAAHRIKHGHCGQQHQHRQPAASGQKSIGPQPRTGALGHKGRAPDEGAEQQQEGILRLCVHQPIPSTLSRP